MKDIAVIIAVWEFSRWCIRKIWFAIEKKIE
jgi:hypothetical protein